MIPAQYFNYEYFTGLKQNSDCYPTYYDFIINYLFKDLIIKEKPESILDLGCGRGHLLHKFQNSPIRSFGMEVSRHCILTRVVNNMVEWDVTNVPWPFKDQEFDLAFSNCLFDYISDEHVPKVINELYRVTKRGLHVASAKSVNPFAPPRPIKWWSDKLRADHRILDYEDVVKMPCRMSYNTGPIKLNCGSGQEMFHHGWINIDNRNYADMAKSNGGLFYNLNLLQPLPATTASVTAIKASHVIDYFAQDEAEFFLDECWRILMVGGIIRVSVPDIALLQKVPLQEYREYSAETAKAQNADELYEILAIKGRKSSYDPTFLCATLQKLGFSKIEIKPFAQSSSNHIQIETYDTQPEWSVHVDARKLTI